MDHSKIQILDNSPLEQRLSLIEKAFNYKKPHSFEIDFLPLFQSEFNSSHFAIQYDNQIIAHIGYCLREIVIDNKIYNVAFLGGIAVKDEFKGKGFFKHLMVHTLKVLDPKVSFYLLWSGENELYKKFNFHQCGSIFSSGNEELNFNVTTLNKLSDVDLSKIQELYERCWPNRVLRSEQQWQQIRRINSVQVYLEYQNNTVSSYAFIGKGFDLNGIIHEFGSIDLNDFIKRMEQYKCWSPILSNLGDETQLWLGIARPGGLWNETQTVWDFINQNDIMIGGIDSI